MRNILWFLLTVLLLTRAGAQSNTPVRLALIAESSEASTASDLLTVELSKNPQIRLLERNEIEKVYREQGLSAANRDYLKLGQVLGADGLLLVSTIAQTNQRAIPGQFAARRPEKIDLRIQLVAVRPGVLLASERFSVPDDLSQWAQELVGHLNPLLPKLTVLMRDSVPISIVNLRSAIQSPETKEVEQQLTTLAIERLSREPQLFLLERTKMQLLAGEKELNGMDDSAFWNGSYLLEGTLDRDGYSNDKITLSARLVPPNGGVPVSIEVSANRTNLAHLINQLAEKVRQSLRVVRIAAPWNSADESQKYFEEAKWALKWNLISEAQAASESAWALGRQDLECAQLRVKACILELTTTVVRYQDSESSISPGFDAAGNPNGPLPSEAEVREMIQSQLKEYPFGAVYRRGRSDPRGVVRVNFAFAGAAPTESNIDRAIRLLEMYENFSHAHPESLLPAPADPANTKTRQWSGLGVDALIASSKVLRDFNFAPQFQQPVASKLADLRAMARAVAGTISRTTPIADGYFIGERVATHDELYHTLKENQNIFSCEVDWGAFWQDRPVETLNLYRELMSSPAFCYLHSHLWSRELTQPRLVAWNEEDRKLIPELWNRFGAELKTSTNVLWQMEAEALAEVDAVTGEQARTAESNWWKLVRLHRQELVGNKVELFSDGWGFADNQETREMDREYWDKTIPTLKTAFAFEKQKRYLADLTPYNFSEFNNTFVDKNYSKSQAAELKPLVEAYQSNLIAQGTAASTNRMQKAIAESDARWVGLALGRHIDEIVNSKSSSSPATALVSTSAASAPRSAITDMAPATFEPLTNVLVAKIFLSVPKGQLPASNLQSIVVFEHRMHGDNLMLGLRYRDDWWEQSVNSTVHLTKYRQAAALWNAGNGWNVAVLPHAEDFMGGGDFMEGTFGRLRTKLFMEIFEDALYMSDRDAIRRYDWKQKQAYELPFPGQNRAQLFAVNHHLYAASSEGIWEILNDGQSARILAGTRRRPVASLLDSRETLAEPVLFSGPSNALCVAIDGEVFLWEGADWKPFLMVPNSGRPEIFQNMEFFRAGPKNQVVELWRLMPGENKPVLCVREEQKSSSGAAYRSEPTPLNQLPAPLWKTPRGVSVGQAPAALDGSSIYFLINRSLFFDNGVSPARVVEEHGRHADLVCLVSNFPTPLVIPLRFDTTHGPVPAQNKISLNNTIWIDCSHDYLFVGASSLSGVWAVPTSQIHAELDRQIQLRRSEDENRKHALLAEYDRNRNGVLDPEEKESAITDPAFLEFELDKIDVDGNENLDPKELSYFDANQNGILDEPEEAAIHLTQRLLASRLCKNFDWNENGQLDQNEFFAIFRNGPEAAQAFNAFRNGEGKSDADKLGKLCEKTLENKLRPAWRPGIPMRRISPNSPPGEIGLKQMVETFWAQQRADSVANKP